MKLRSGKLLASTSFQKDTVPESKHNDCYLESTETTESLKTADILFVDETKKLLSSEVQRKKCDLKSDVKAHSKKKVKSSLPTLLCARSTKNITSVNLERKKKIVLKKNPLLDNCNQSDGSVNRAKNETIENKMTALNKKLANPTTGKEKRKKNANVKKYESPDFKELHDKHNLSNQRVNKPVQMMCQDTIYSSSCKDGNVALSQTLKERENGLNSCLQGLNISSLLEKNICDGNKDCLPIVTSASCKISLDVMSTVKKNTSSVPEKKSCNLACELDDQNTEGAVSELSDTMKDLSISGAAEENISDLKLSIDHLVMALNRTSSDLNDTFKRLNISSVLNKAISDLNRILQHLIILSAPQKMISNETESIKELLKIPGTQHIVSELDNIVKCLPVSFPDGTVADSTTGLTNIIEKFKQYISSNGSHDLKEDTSLQALKTSFQQISSDLSGSIRSKNTCSLPSDNTLDLSKNDEHNILLSSFPSKTDSVISDDLKIINSSSNENLLHVKNTLQHLSTPTTSQNISNPVENFSSSVAVKCLNLSFSTSKSSLLPTPLAIPLSNVNPDSMQFVQSSLDSTSEQTNMQNVKSCKLNDNMQPQGHTKDRMCEPFVKFNSSSQYNLYCSENYNTSAKSFQKDLYEETAMRKSLLEDKYGSNIYIPKSFTVEKKGLRPVIIDGNNVAYGHGGNNYFSYRGIKLCVHFFLRKGHRVTVFLPHSRKVGLSVRNKVILEELERLKIIAYTPSRKYDTLVINSYDDWYIVQCAAILGGVIVSNDFFRDLLKKMPAFSDTIKYRLLMYTWVGDVLMFPVDPLGKNGPSLDQFLRF